jgi:hypothetical protein
MHDTTMVMMKSVLRDDPDAWVEDVRRWFFGGAPPSEPLWHDTQPGVMHHEPIPRMRHETATARRERLHCGGGAGGGVADAA